MQETEPVPNGRMSSVDAAFLYLERKEIPLNIGNVALFENVLPFDDFVAHVDTQLDLIPRFRQIVVPAPFHIGHPAWNDDPHFDIRRHIFRVRLPRPGSEAQLEALAGRLFGTCLDRGKPLWDMHVVEGLKNGRGALILRVHHALADGVSGVGFVNVILSTSPAVEPIAGKRGARRRRPQAPASVVQAICDAIYGTLENLISAEANILAIAGTLATGRLASLARVLPELAAPVQRLPFNKPCGSKRKFCWAQMDFAAVQAIRAYGGGTVNDVVLTVLTRALAKYVKLHGETVTNRLVRVVCPVNLRSGEQSRVLGNQITFLPVNLPLNVRDPLHNLRAVAATMAAMKNARAADLVGLLGNCIGAAPAPLQAMFWSGLPVFPLPLPLLNIICTNVPGWRVPLYAIGNRMLTSYPQVPTGYDLGVGCAVQSYDGKLFFGLTADAGVAPDVHRLRDYLRVSFEELCRAAGIRKTAPRAQRRAPAPVSPPQPVQTVEPPAAPQVAEAAVAAQAGN